ncbi:MAG: hypothetical protein O6924_01540 [Alphaproteobacteria bacterium]|nr:hypothetical protein [Alphaproteobacteria bacterium]
MMKRCLGLFLATTILLTGCVGYTLVKGGQKLELGQGISVKPPRDWNRRTEGKHEIWTLDGPGLQYILFVKGIEDGGRIFPASRRRASPKKDTFPKFRKGMSLLEVRELFEASLSRYNAQKIAIAGFAPAEFGGKDGFRFTFTYSTESGLNMRGIVAGALLGDKLFMVIYNGTELFFFDRSKGDFEKILASLTII